MRKKLISTLAAAAMASSLIAAAPTTDTRTPEADLSLSLVEGYPTLATLDELSEGLAGSSVVEFSPELQAATLEAWSDAFIEHGGDTSSAIAVAVANSLLLWDQGSEWDDVAHLLSSQSARHEIDQLMLASGLTDAALADLLGSEDPGRGAAEMLGPFSFIRNVVISTAAAVSGLVIVAGCLTGVGCAPATLVAGTITAAAGITGVALLAADEIYERETQACRGTATGQMQGTTAVATANFQCSSGGFSYVSTLLLHENGQTDASSTGSCGTPGGGCIRTVSAGIDAGECRFPAAFWRTSRGSEPPAPVRGNPFCRV